MIKTERAKKTYDNLATISADVMTLRHTIERGLYKTYENAEKGARWLNASELKQTIKGECIIGLLRQFESLAEDLRVELAHNSEAIDNLITNANIQED